MKQSPLFLGLLTNSLYNHFKNYGIILEADLGQLIYVSFDPAITIIRDNFCDVIRVQLKDI